MNKEEVSSLKFALESVILTAVINDHEEREVSIVDIPDAFIQTYNTEKVVDQRYIIKIKGKLAQILVEITT